MRNKPEAIETFVNGSLVAEVRYDEDPEGPRNTYNLGTMTCWHQRRNLGDVHWGPIPSPGERAAWVKKMERKGAVVLPLYLYDHGGLTMSTSPFSCPWDSGQVGFIFAEREKILEEFYIKRVTKRVRESVFAYLVGEVEEYDKYLQGEVYCVVTVDTESGDIVDSCYGFYDLEYAKEYARESIGLPGKDQEEEGARYECRDSRAGGGVRLGSCPVFE